MTTNDQVNAFGLLRQLNVFIVANVGQGNDPGNIFLCLDKIDGSLDSCYWVLEKGSCARIRDLGGGRGSHSNHRKAVVFENNVRNQGLIKRFIVGMDVAGGDWECQVFCLMRTNQSAPNTCLSWGRYAYKCSEDIVPSIELMVSDCHNIETKLIEGIRNFLTPIVTVEQSTLSSNISYLAPIQNGILVTDRGANLKFVPSVQE